MKKLSQKGLDLLKGFEGFREHAYLDQGGKWTVGYGSTRGVFPGTVVTEQQAEEMLAQEVRGNEKTINTIVTCPLNQNEFDALVCFVYNVGSHAFQISTLLSKLNKNEDRKTVAQEFLRWNKIHGETNRILTLRREKEQKLFLTPIISNTPPTAA